MSCPPGIKIIAAIVLASPCVANKIVNAQDVSVSDIRAALLRDPSRSLSEGARLPPAASPAADVLFDTLGRKAPSSMTLDERTQLDAAIEGKPSIDLVMEFDSNSDVLRGKALETANKLGIALSDPAMKERTFAIAGHTDGKGSKLLNQTLSERRAVAVKTFLVERYHIPPENLISVGYGKSRLKNKADPLSRENRRVQAVNLLRTRTAGKGF